MTNLYYWAKDNNSGTTIETEDHYLRLGVYNANLGEDDIADKENDDSVAEGIFFYTNGKYSLKSTNAFYFDITGPVDRTIKNGGYTYTNDGGDFTVDANKGGIKIHARKSVTLKGYLTDTNEKETGFLIDAGNNNIEYEQKQYFKETKDKKEKFVKGSYHKTNYGYVGKVHLGSGIKTYATFAFGYSGLSVGVKTGENSNKGAALSVYAYKAGCVPISKIGCYFVDAKKTVLDEEFCMFKNETKIFKFENGLADYKKNYGVEAFKALLKNKASPAQVLFGLALMKV